MRRTALHVTASIATLASVTCAHAEEQAAPTLQEIVVTGEKAARSLQETTASVAVVTARRLEQENVQSLSELFQRTANLSETYGSSGFTIRGMANQGVSGGGPFIAWTLFSVGALCVVTTGVQVRVARSRAERSLAPEPSDRPSRTWRGWLRALLAGPIGMVAAMGVAIAFAVWAPMAPQTRIIIGGLMVPVLWGGAMAWTLADDRILRATAVLIGVSVVTFTAAVLKGF